MPTSTKFTGPVSLLEFIKQTRPVRVDRERGVIFSVKVLGWESSNGRAYTVEAARRALPLYEGRVVNIDHPGRPQDDRSSMDRFGKLVSPRIEEDGVYADLHYLKSHPMAERIVEAAERMPELFGLSHVAAGKQEHRNGKTYVVEITDVRSVDLVADPATNRGLFESKRKPMANAKLKEQDEMPVEAPAAVDMDGRGLLSQAVGLLAASGDAADHDLAKKIMNLLKPETAEEPAAEAEGDEGEPKEEKPMESKKAKAKPGEVDLKDRKIAVLELCLSEGVKLSPVQQKAAYALEGDELKEFVTSLKAPEKAGNTNGKPRATAPRYTEAKAPKGDEIDVPEFKDAAAFARWLAD